MQLRLTLFATSLVLFGCTGLFPELDTGPTDADGDGVPSDRDCDDGDASILPGGEEGFATRTVATKTATAS